jgi:hypothetical protein
MKKVLFLLLISIVSNNLFSQEQNPASVEKSIFGIQTGFLGIWVHNESRLSNEIALRSEIGFNASIFDGTFYPKTGFLMTPVISIEPRWYYSLQKRAKKSRNISNNSANYLSLESSFNPNWFVISNYDSIETVNQLSVIPTWGIKRAIGKHFNYETGIGIGYTYYFAKSEGYAENVDGVIVKLQLRIGYTF